MLSCPTFVRNCQYGISSKMPWKDAIFSTLYKSFHASTVSAASPTRGQDWGAVFGFGFSPDGSMLVAACEKRCMLVYDPNNARLISRRTKTHNDCVNCVRFLDSRLFVTCSDDNTVRLWDARNLSHELKILRGHTSWVKNIEYSSSTGKLITSGFDGNIFAWDINNYSENDQAQHLLFINGMMRTKICPDERRMVLSTHNGYFILIHDLDLDHIKADLHGFRPRPAGLIDELMHMLRMPLDPSPPPYESSEYNEMFHRKRNRVDFISDFPEGDNAESISTMQVHPQGWCIVSRNTTTAERSEWTCVHDIQAFSNHKEEELSEAEPPDTNRVIAEPSSASNGETASEKQVSSSFQSVPGTSFSMSGHCNHGVPWSSTSSTSSSSTTQESSSHISHSGGSSNGLSAPLGNNTNSNSNNGTSRGSHRVQRHVGRTRGGIFHLTADADESESVLDNGPAPARGRLLFHSEEPNVGQGYIKEQSFSSDGRIIASPFGNCVRLLAFDADCHELCDTVPSKARPLRQVALVAGNKSSVLTSIFSPTHLMYVAGAEDGSISFCSPRL